MAAAVSTSPLGYGLLTTFCTAVLPFPQAGGAPPIMRAITVVQPTFGLATDPSSGALLPDVASGRTLLAADVIRRLSTAIGTLPDTKIPTTMGRYGVDLLDSIAADMTTADIGQFCAQIDAQIKLEERIVNSRTTAVLAGNILLVNIALVDGSGPFQLVLAVNVLTQNLQVLS